MRALALGYERLCRGILLVAVVNALIMVHALLGLMLLGLFPAVAAAMTTLRSALLDEDRTGGVMHTVRLFHGAWRAELGPANRLGWAQLVAGALLAWDYYLVNWNPLGGTLGIAVSGILLLVLAGYAVVCLISWVVHAHVDAGAVPAMRMSALLALTRPLCAVGVAVTAGAVVASWRAWPGVGLAFGPAMLLGAVLLVVAATGRLEGLRIEGLRTERRRPVDGHPSAPVSRAVAAPVEPPAVGTALVS